MRWGQPRGGWGLPAESQTFPPCFVEGGKTALRPPEGPLVPGPPAQPQVGLMVQPSGRLPRCSAGRCAGGSGGIAFGLAGGSFSQLASPGSLCPGWGEHLPHHGMPETLRSPAIRTSGGHGGCWHGPRHRRMHPARPQPSERGRTAAFWVQAGMQASSCGRPRCLHRLPAPAHSMRGLCGAAPRPSLNEGGQLLI